MYMNCSKKRSLLFFFGLMASFAIAQIAPDCSGAIPICSNTPTNGGTNGFGADDFNGASESGCLEQTLSGAIESNSAWYRFRTGASGQLGFNISFDVAEDWDFALYKTSDCGNLGDPVRCNFFDNSDGMTHMGVGEDPTGDADTVLYEEWLDVTAGEDYYLMINNFSETNSGFSIQFSGNIFVTNPNNALDCSIVSNLLGSPIVACSDENVVLDATTATATGYNWYADIGSGFQIMTGENNPTLNVLSDALYRVEVITPSETIISDVQVAFSVAPISFLLSDDAYCSENNFYDLSIKDTEALGAQNSDDFMVTYHSSQADALAGERALSKEFDGGGTIYARVSSAENPNCFDASEQFQLSRVETPLVNAENKVFICENANSITIGDVIQNPNYSYSWDSGEVSSEISVSQAGVYVLTVRSNNLATVCETIVNIEVVISVTPSITDVIIEDVQANNTVTIVTDVEGDFEYKIDNGAYQASNTFINILAGEHTVTINDPKGCGTVSENIMVIGFSKFFSPNGDGRNDDWGVVGMSMLTEPVVYVYDRYGKLIKQLTNQNPTWNGVHNGKQLPSSDYWFKLSYKNTEGQRVFAKYLNNHFSLRR